MSTLKEYTVELYKADKRTKKCRRLFSKQEYAHVTQDYINSVAYEMRNLGFIVEIHETWVTKKNIITGDEFQEKYDTPRCCSPSSELYWCM